MRRVSQFESIRPGDAVVRILGGAPMQLVVTAVDDRLIYCGPPGVGWKFDRVTGAEVDEDLGWGPGFGISGSYLLPPDELEQDLAQGTMDRYAPGSHTAAATPRVRFRTETGSTYEVDNVGLTWRRESRALASGRLRSESGLLLAPVTPEVGLQALLVCPPFEPRLGPRLVVTSRVVKVDLPEKPVGPTARQRRDGGAR